MTYFHARLCTIIGAVSFHGPVRDGKGWFQRAMGTRHKRCLRVGARGAPVADVFGRSKDCCVIAWLTGVSRYASDRYP